MFGASLRRSVVLKVHVAILEPVMEIFRFGKNSDVDEDYFDFGNGDHNDDDNGDDNGDDIGGDDDENLCHQVQPGAR